MPALTVFRVVRENSSQTDRKSEERIAGCATMIMVGVREGECHPEALRFRLRFRLRLVSYLTHVHHGESVNFEGASLRPRFFLVSVKTTRRRSLGLYFFSVSF